MVTHTEVQDGVRLQYVAFSDRLLSLSNAHLSFPLSFRGAMAHFFPVLDSTLFPGCATVY